MKLWQVALMSLLISSNALPNGETTSTNMGLSIPAVGITTGPQWASDLNISLNLIDAHDHSSGKGAQITPSGINISSDLTCNSHNITSTRSIRFNPYASSGTFNATASDIGALFEISPDLYYLDGSGNSIRITQSGSVAGSAGTITGLPSGTASAAYTSGSGTFVFQQSTSTAANMDVGTLLLRYPGSYPAPAGNYIALQAPTSLATGYSLTFPATSAATSGAFLTSSTAGIISYTNTDNSTVEISSNTLRLKDSGVTTAKIADLAVTAAKIANTTITGAQIANATISGTQVAASLNMSGTPQASGRFITSSSVNNSGPVVISRGLVSQAGGILAGEGFSVVHSSTGVYVVTLNPTLSDQPAVTVSPDDTGVFSVLSALTRSITSSGFTVIIKTEGGAAADSTFNFIAIGQH